ncbi:MAG TPA: HAMP domain-containing sensor histidine kinase [Gammaproteobacteria bacterium]|nr:HAMP domain-containing sensor histidine kinase [Gammaproteobacteria bacterium]
MRIARPKSLFGLILIGFALVAVPLLAAVLWAAVYMDRLAERSEALIVNGVQATRASRLIVEQITSLERNARLYQVLNDPGMLNLYVAKHSELKDTIESLSRLLAHAAVTESLVQLRATSESILADLRAGEGTPELMPDRFRALSAHAGVIAGASNRLIDAELGLMQSSARRAQRGLAWMSAALLPGTLALVIVFTLLVARPIRQIDRAISELGKGTFSRPLVVTGPRDLELLGQQLEWLRLRLLELAQEKNKFLRQMSHELKTPLANIREGTELLMDGAVGELARDQREVTGILRDNGLKLQQLIENLLTFSAWQSRSAQLELSDFELGGLIRQVVRHHRLALVRQRIRLELDVTEMDLYADAEKLRMVIDNLISNATKFTPAGGVIHVKAVASDRDAIIDVADTGPGVPAADRPHIFEAFYQGRLPQGGHVGGTGIGLSVVLECVRAHGGIVELVDGEYPGAHFRIRMPREQVRPRRPVAVNA